MPTARTVTPLWVKLVVCAVVLGAPAWWLSLRHQRLGNEARLAAAASVIAGRDVRVHCPGTFVRLSGWAPVDGSVAFGPDGRPADVTRLSAATCAELDALAEGRRAGVVAGAQAEALARAVDVLTHESWHLQGVIDEAVTECRSLQTMAWAATRLGATEPQGGALARLQLAVGYDRLPPRYRSRDCRDGGRLDMDPRRAGWP